MYTPMSARVPGYESLRDDHGIVYEKRRIMAMGALVGLGIVGDDDGRQRKRVRDRVWGIKDIGRRG